MKHLISHVIVGEIYIDAITGKTLKVIDDNNKKPLAKYYCEEVNGPFACWRNAKDLNTFALTPTP